MYQMREKEELVPGNIRRYQIGVISGSGFPSAISNPPVRYRKQEPDRAISLHRPVSLFDSDDQVIESE